MQGIYLEFQTEMEGPVNGPDVSGLLRDDWQIQTIKKPGLFLGAYTPPASLSNHVLDDPDAGDCVVLAGESYEEISYGGVDYSKRDFPEFLLEIARTGHYEVLSRLNALFCAGVWIAARKELVVITDRYGTFPVHLWKGPGGYRLATHIAIALQDGLIPKRMNRRALAQLFTMQRTVGDVTTIEGMTALPAASVTRINDKRIATDRYWTANWTTPQYHGMDHGAALAEALAVAVKRQSADRHVGLLLSGGLDSRMLIAAKGDVNMSSWTTASYAENPELKIASDIAALGESRHAPLIVDPADTLGPLAKTTVESNGHYPASVQMSVFMDKVADGCDAIMTGHGLDYTFRGYYLPASFLELAGSKTRLPRLRKLPKTVNGMTVLDNLRQGPPRSTIDRILRPEIKTDWWEGQYEEIERALQPWMGVEDVSNIWDAFILHSVSKHYAFTSMMAVRASANLLMPCYDRDVFQIYLSMSPEQRIQGSVARKAMERLSPAMAAAPNANSGLAASTGAWAEIFGVLGQSVARKIGLKRRENTPTGMHSAGSWQNLGVMYREDPGHVALFMDIRKRLDSLTFGLLDSDQLANCIDEHLSGVRQHNKLLRQLMTHDAWVQATGLK